MLTTSEGEPDMREVVVVDAVLVLAAAPPLLLLRFLRLLVKVESEYGYC